MIVLYRIKLLLLTIITFLFSLAAPKSYASLTYVPGVQFGIFSFRPVNSAPVSNYNYLGPDIQVHYDIFTNVHAGVFISYLPGYSQSDTQSFGKSSTMQWGGALQAKISGNSDIGIKLGEGSYNLSKNDAQGIELPGTMKGQFLEVSFGVNFGSVRKKHPWRFYLAISHLIGKSGTKSLVNRSLDNVGVGVSYRFKDIEKDLIELIFLKNVL